MSLMELKTKQNSCDTLEFDALESLASAGKLMAIVDAIAHSDVAGFAAELIAEEKAASIPKLGESEFLSEDAVPYLVRISPRFWRFLTTQVWIPDEQDHDPRWGLFFELKEFEEQHWRRVFEKVRNHWRYWYQVALPVTGSLTSVVEPNASENKHLPAVFRFFDPRLIEGFIEASNEAEVRAFFGPVSRFLLPQADGSLKSLAAPSADESMTYPAANGDPKTPFLMRHEHLAALELKRLECRLPAFLQYLEKHFDEKFDHWQIKDRDAFMRQGLRQATTYGCLSEHSALGWLSLQLLHGPDFIDNKPWALKVLNDKRHTIGGEDRAARLIKMGFNQARLNEQTGLQA